MPKLNMFKIRQQMLEYLYLKLNRQPDEETLLSSSKTSLEEISEYLQVSITEVDRHHLALSLDNHIECSYKNGHSLMLTQRGVYAALDKYWISQGEKERNDKIYDKTKWLVPVITVIISMAAITISIIALTHKVQ